MSWETHGVSKEKLPEDVVGDVMKPGKGKTSSSFLCVWGKLSFPSCVFLPSVSLYPHGDHITSETPGHQYVVVSPYTRQFSVTPAGLPTLETGVWYALPGDGIGFHLWNHLSPSRLPPTPRHTHTPQMPVSGADCHLCFFRSTSCRSVSHDPSPEVPLFFKN